MKKWLFIALGSITFALGTIGIFLPFLPTTVFYLLTGFFWLRSSEKLYQKFIQSKNYQKYIKETLIEKKITNKGMIKMFLMILVIFLIPGILVNNLIMRISLTVVYIAHVIGLTWYLKGKEKKQPKASDLGEMND
ncbi:hypothetical protein RV11_GL002485 [Enterococcus phoeniculicola]|jgi:uncharacterized membrane protein YbaN (DUF454 family)|uniref:DUF454 domain-containing protein n=1 Tax=Enterococcus phoeniculicola ATCC BAA-412 TaxID=1158610 RepID=R3W9Z7_9ENTE|nr:YbaN family protein [Enterococcus phoeniculicola]EOL44736.1 hypothetical protein UC3_01553 [Enterococcus phoeniculicola ATCC BAA-412]EOT75025.1 hypothetical protein I589_02625 [Enterococcus phoeniculicola ATCC BAA-412]OJG72911.1 hypothetical protein RV11_GL002485 [Enterococcus phoeniculicola]